MLVEAVTDPLGWTCPIGRGGNGRIGSFMAGAIRRADGTPVAGEVCLREAGGSFGYPVIAVIQADTLGGWELTGLPLDRLFRAEVRDKGRELNGAVLDWLQPVPM